jgi:membrane protease YdiL (CAAX protease family)
MWLIWLSLALAIACTTALDASGLTSLSALPLIPIFAAFAFSQRIRASDLGFVRGRLRDYGLALGHPCIVTGGLALLAYVGGAIEPSHFDAARTAANFLKMTFATFLIAIVTEEGFFRGWLWAALERCGISNTVTLILTSGAFVLWHVSYVFLSGAFEFASSDIPLFFVNAALLGLIWGMLRLVSGSVIVSSAGHALWNGLVYVLFGIGSKVGALGIVQVSLFGPEVGLFGASLNLILFCAIAWRFRHQLRLGAGAPIAT